MHNTDRYSAGVLDNPLEKRTISDSRPKWAKRIPAFRPKRRKNATRWGATYLYSLNKGLPPPLPPPPRQLVRSTASRTKKLAPLANGRFYILTG